MPVRRRWLDDAEAEEEANRQTASLAGIAITLLLLVIGLFLIRELHTKAQIEDCLMAGRANCDILVHAALWSPM
ncbi:MAG TPA: hypothetical protein VMU81_00445 [Acetobacteraceae bacterium]|nr:hypothetical protein [Acetobacteraceae bacterium]